MTLKILYREFTYGYYLFGNCVRLKSSEDFTIDEKLDVVQQLIIPLDGQENPLDSN